MQQRELVSGFSELKDLLIRTYQIERGRELVKLYFSEEDNKLLMHDYDNHKKVIRLCLNLERKNIWNGLTGNAHRLVNESLKHASPSEFLIQEFQLNGFFRS